MTNAPSFDITTAHADRCGVCQSPDVESVSDGGQRVVCIECEARGIRCGREWVWATGRAVRSMRAAFDDANRRYEDEVSA